MPPKYSGLMSYNLSHQYLQLVCECILSLSCFWGLIIKIPYQGIDHLTKLKSNTEVVYSVPERTIHFYGSSPNNIHLQATLALMCNP